MLKIRVLNFDVNNTPIFLGCQGSQMEKKSGEKKKKKRKPIHFRPVKMVFSNTVIKKEKHP